MQCPWYEHKNVSIFFICHNRCFFSMRHFLKADYKHLGFKKTRRWLLIFLLISHSKYLFKLSLPCLVTRGWWWGAFADSDSRQTQTPAEISQAFTEAPGSTWAPSLGEAGGWGGQRKQTWDGSVEAPLSGHKPELLHLIRPRKSPNVQWRRHRR